MKGADASETCSTAGPVSRPVLRRVGESGLVGAVAVVIAAVLYRVWEASFAVPFNADQSDTTFITAMVKTIHDHGWLDRNPSLGAPFGTQFYDFPHAGESFQLAVIKGLTLFIDKPGAVVNVYFLLGFGVLAAVTYLVLRHLFFDRPVCAVVALLYTFLPFHFWHGEQHLWRSAYVASPLACLLIIWVLAWRRRFLRQPDAALWPRARLRQNVLWWRVAGAAAICVVIGGTETMTTAFSAVALAVTAVIVAIRRRDPGVLAAAVSAILVIGVTFLLLSAPTLWYWHEHGTNSTTARRVPAEQEIYGLQISQLFLPVPDHRAPSPNGLQRSARHYSPLGREGGQELGVIGAVGFLVVLYELVANGLRRRGGELHPANRHLLLENGGLTTLVLVLFSTASGLGLIMSLFGFAQLRVWGRTVTLFGFFCLLPVAMVLERALRRLLADHATRGRVAGAALLLAVLAFGLWDTAVPPPLRYEQASARADSTRRFMNQVEALLPSQARVFQLPVIAFPESPPLVGMIDYDELWPYVWSHNIRFSYGAMKGRPEADWQKNVDSADPTPSLAGLAGLGFDAVMVDSAGFPDRGTAVSSALTDALGPPPAASSDGRLRLWDLRGFASRQGLTRPQLDAAAKTLLRQP